MYFAFTPSPVILSKVSSVAITASGEVKCLTTASAKGCSDCASIVNNKSDNSFCAASCFQATSTTSGLPSVMVPVLSNMITLMFFACSRLSASLIRIPFSAPLPTPTIIAVGVANPNAHGQAITNTVTSASKPCVNPLSPPNISHAIRLSIATPITIGTKMPAILSTSF